MNARRSHSRAQARVLRTALSGASALVLLAGVALPVGFSPSSVEPFQKTALAKGDGPGASGNGGGPPDHSNAGGNGGGHGNGHGGLTSSDYDEEDGDEGPKLGKLHAGNAAEAAFINANEDSTVGQLALYKAMVVSGEIEDVGDAMDFLMSDFANKLVDEDVVTALNELLGVDFVDVVVEPEPEE